MKLNQGIAIDTSNHIENYLSEHLVIKEFYSKMVDICNRYALDCSFDHIAMNKLCIEVFTICNEQLTCSSNQTGNVLSCILTLNYLHCQRFRICAILKEKNEHSLRETVKTERLSVCLYGSESPFFLFFVPDTISFYFFSLCNDEEN